MIDNTWEIYKIDIPDGELYYIPNYIPELEAQTIYRELYHQTPWRQDEVTVFGKKYQQPRLTALFADVPLPYSYAGLTLYPVPFLPILNTLRQQISRDTSITFNSCLLNLYRDGRDSNGWHADNEKELGMNPWIASLSFGEERSFRLKHRYDKSQKLKMDLIVGSLVLMGGKLQQYWLHQIPKTAKMVQPRINATFRFLHSKK